MRHQQPVVAAPVRRPAAGVVAGKVREEGREEEVDRRALGRGVRQVGVRVYVEVRWVLVVRPEHDRAAAGLRA